MSFLYKYLEYSTDNEAPDMFHVWSGYTCIASAVSRRVWLPFGDEAIFPNVYVMLVGNAGNGKSHALRKAKRLLSELPSVPMARSVETPEGLCRFMGGDKQATPPIESPVAFITKWADGHLREVHPMTIVANEFINFISQNQAGWMNLLNDIYDEDRYEYRTKNKGEDCLLGPYICLLGALTTDVSADLQKAKIISTGFARRTLFQFGERKWHDPHAIPSYDDNKKAARAFCVDHLKQLTTLNGAFTWLKECQDWWVTWYNQHSVQVPKQTPQLQSWFASKPMQVIKIAMLTCLSESLDLVLKVEHFQTALAYLAELEKGLARIFGGVGRNELAAVAMTILNYLDGQTEPIARRKLKALFWSSCKPPNDFEECISYLLAEGRIEESILQVGQSVDSIIATPKTMQAFRSRVATGA